MTFFLFLIFLSFVALLGGSIFLAYQIANLVIEMEERTNVR